MQYKEGYVVNKAHSAVLATLTLSVLNLCVMILSMMTKTRVFSDYSTPDYSPMVITLFTVFLITLGVLSIWQLFSGLDGQAMRGKILLLLAVLTLVTFMGTTQKAISIFIISFLYQNLSFPKKLIRKLI